MAYSDFTLRQALDGLGLSDRSDRDLFAGIAPVEPSDYLRQWLAEFAPVATAVNSEQARREYIISPILAEAKRRSPGPANVFPGVTLDVDRDRGLNGYCDYVIVRSSEIYYLRSPLAAVIEAKREDLSAGLGQCAAAMVGIQVFNERDGSPVPTVYGAVTSGTNWRFLCLTGTTLFIDRPEYFLSQADLILGILTHIMSPAPGVAPPAAA